MIKMGEFIEAGKFYHSRCGNVIYIEEETEKADKDGRFVSRFRGTLVEVINGHKILKNKTHWFNEKGKWEKMPGGIHDLVKLCHNHKKPEAPKPEKDKGNDKPKKDSKGK